MTVEYLSDKVVLKNATDFDIEKTLDCGQAFRWKQNEDGSWFGIAYGKSLKLFQNGDTVTFYTDKKDFDELWSYYFDLKRDYRSICQSFNDNIVLKEACVYGSGIRILKQEPWEALCSFIFSQNNNIPRIKGIIERFCKSFGNKLENGGYSFPSPQRIAELTLDDLAVIRSGFRAKYILATAKSIASGEVNLERVAALPIDQARLELMKLYGVGEKVADCTLLFGLGFLEAFPKDVWIKRVVEKLFDNNFPSTPYAGIAQQFLFYYARTTKLEV